MDEFTRLDFGASSPVESNSNVEEIQPEELPILPDPLLPQLTSLLCNITNPSAIKEVLEGLFELAQRFKFVITLQQAADILDAIKNFRQIDKSITDSIIQLTNVILDFSEPFNAENFCDAGIVSILFDSIPSLYVFPALCSYAAYGLKFTKEIEKFDSEKQFNKFITEGSPNTDQFLFFLGCLLRDKQYHPRIAELTNAILEKFIFSWDGSLRFEALYFFFQISEFGGEPLKALKGNHYFHVIFQAYNDNSNNLALVLGILRNSLISEAEPCSFLFGLNLLPFVCDSLKKEEDVVVCFAIDVVTEIARESRGFDVIVENGILAMLLEVLEGGRSYQAKSCAVLTLSVMAKNGSVEQKLSLAQNGIARYFTDYLDCVTAKGASSLIKGLIELLVVSEQNGLANVSDDVFSNSEACETLESMSESHDNQLSTLALCLLARHHS